MSLETLKQEGIKTNYCNRKENNSESQLILEFNKAKINKQCEKVLNLLRMGHRLTVRDALLFYKIGDLRRRIKDLKDFHGIDIKSKMIGHGFKEYYL